MKTISAVLVFCLLLSYGLSSEKKRDVNESIDNLKEELSEFKMETEERFEAIEEAVANNGGILIDFIPINEP